MFAIKTILHPTDFSPRSQAAFEMACSLARERQARLVLLHVVEVPLVVQSGVMTPPPPPPPEEEKNAAWSKIKAIKAPDNSIALDYRVVMGDVGTSILDVAKEVHADLIVLGTHGRTGLSRLLMGSVAEKVVRNAACPVLTLKTPA
ncbi:MAG: universal stress protein [Planctomycetes bacterium]|nr:universal stress protein [Planctomycetota bacterium]